jgi:hypothetical protein
MVREVHFAWDGDNGVETTLVRAAECRLSETHDWDLGEFADAIPLAAQEASAGNPAAEDEADELDEPTPPVQSESRRRRRRSGDDPKRHLAGANWLAYMPGNGLPTAGKMAAEKTPAQKTKVSQQADAGR